MKIKVTLQKNKEDKYWFIQMDNPSCATQGGSIPDALRMLAEAYEVLGEDK